MSIGLDARNTVCVARQPILDLAGRVYGYELLYRSSAEATACTAEGDIAGARVLTDAVLSLGLDVLTSGRPAFLNFTRSLLMNGAATLLPPTSVVIELLENIAIDNDVVEMCRGLHNKGFALALDDFEPGSPAESLVPYASFVKVDVLNVPADERKKLAARLVPRGIRMIAEKVETAEIVEEARTHGYRLFQGYYFCRPKTFSASSMAGRHMAYLTLLGALNRDDLGVDELEDLVKHDVSLSFRVLRSVNSWLYGLRHEVTSIRHALVLLGIDQIRKWASVWVLAGLNSTGTQETVNVAILRARCCELIGDHLVGPDEGPSYFLLGLCSLLDVVLGRPMAEALSEMPLPAALNDALLGEQNDARYVLDAVLAYEQGKWTEANTAMEALRLPPDLLPGVYAEALRWARELLKTTSGGPR
jgi:EAL and modified HD-GYP domain-containing signal transduction protein